MTSSPATTSPVTLTRVILVTNDDDDGRVGTVLPPDTSLIAYAKYLSPEDAALILGKPGHVIVRLDAEDGQAYTGPGTGHGGRGGKLVCVPESQIRLATTSDHEDA